MECITTGCFRSTLSATGSPHSLQCHPAKRPTQFHHFSAYPNRDLAVVYRSNCDTRRTVSHSSSRQLQAEAVLIGAMRPPGDSDSIFSEQAMTIVSINLLVNSATMFALNGQTCRRLSTLDAQHRRDRIVFVWAVHNRPTLLQLVVRSLISDAMSATKSCRRILTTTSSAIIANNHPGTS